MSHESAAIFAQVIPVLLIGAFLSTRINTPNQNDKITITCAAVLGATTETAILLWLAFDWTIGPVMTGLALTTVIFLLSSTLATIISRLYERQHDKEENQNVQRNSQE